MRGVDALRQSRLRLEGIFHAIPVRVFWKDLNLVYLGCNEAFALDAGLAAPSDIVGKDDFQLVWRDQAERYRGGDRRVIESGVSRLLIEEPQKTSAGRPSRCSRASVPCATPHVDVLRGILPICARCKNIRDDTGFWRQVEHYV